MVTQARDQLRSNETQEDLRAVFEGSCNLIPIKLIRKECDKMVDDFVPELVEALSSQMDPTAVCSVAGLCNNAKIDKMLAQLNSPEWQPESQVTYQKNVFTCQNCSSISKLIVSKFHEANPDDVLDGMLKMCGYVGSYSDSCSSIVLRHFTEIYGHLKQSLTSDGLCHLSGACAMKYHRHDDDHEKETMTDDSIEIRPMSNVGFVKKDNELSADIPCEFCKQLVKHLRNMILVNTTEAEFKTVMVGVCGQMRQLKDECVNFVENYSDTIFEALNSSLNPELICTAIDICKVGESHREHLLMPLIPVTKPQEIKLSLKKVADLKEKRVVLGKDEPKLTAQQIDEFQLPFDKLMGPQNANTLVQGGELCTLCEMVLHFLSVELAQPATEERIKERMQKACSMFPKSVRTTCSTFIESYGDAVVAMLIQDIDASAVCPALKMCSRGQKEDVEVFAIRDVDEEDGGMTVDIQSNDKPTCPLCLLAVTEAKERIKSNKTIENIKHTLETLCTHLPQKLRVECTDFVDSYARQLVDMLIKDLTPQKICVELKLCTQQGPQEPSFVANARDRDNDICEYIQINCILLKRPYHSLA